MSDTDGAPEPAARKTEPALEYTPRFGAGGPVTVRGTRLVIALLLVNTTLLGASVLGPQLFPFLRQQWTQWRARRAEARRLDQAARAAIATRQQALTYSLPVGTVVYEEDPGEASRLLREGGITFSRAAQVAPHAPRGWVPPVKLNAPPFFAEVRSAINASAAGTAADPLLFLHERTTPAGAKHLVAVQMDVHVYWNSRTVTDERTRQLRVDHYQSKTRRLIALSWREDTGPRRISPPFARQYYLRLPDSWERLAAHWITGPGSDRVTPSTDYGNVLRFFAGRPDPADASRFSIPYRLDGRDGVIEGRLKDDGIELRPRDGGWTFDGGEMLRLDAPPATRPTVFPPQPLSD